MVCIQGHINLAERTRDEVNQLKDDITSGVQAGKIKVRPKFFEITLEVSQGWSVDWLCIRTVFCLIRVIQLY